MKLRIFKKQLVINKQFNILAIFLQKQEWKKKITRNDIKLKYS